VCEIQSTEVFLSGFIALCIFSHLLHEVKYKKNEVKMKNDIYRDNVNTRHNETKEEKEMKTLHRKC